MAKICVLNSSGNVGKTTISRELIYPRLKNPLLVEIESYNSSSSAFKNIDSVKFAGNHDFEEFYELIIGDRDLIFDIGASEIANFFDNAIEYSSAINEFDYFVIPSRSDSKIMEDTAKTILFLRSQEIDDSKIRVIFNEVKSDVNTEFKALFNFDFEFNENLFIKQSNLIKDLSLLKTTFLNTYNPDLNFYREEMKKAEDPVQKKKFLKLDLINRASVKKIREFDFLFSSAFFVYTTELENKKVEAPITPKKATPKKATPKKEADEDLENEINENDEDL